MRNIAGLLLMTAVAAGATGCTQVNYTSPDRYERGLVVVLSGAGGMMGECDRLRDGLAAGGVDRALEVYEWSAGEVLSDQASVEANHHKAALLARRIETYLHEYSGRPVHLVGVSAGTGLAVWAIEALTGNDKITGGVLISSSLLAQYDLTRALDRVTDRLYAFTSVADTVLSLGVSVAGTVDRGVGATNPTFVRARIAPLVLGRRPENGAGKPPVQEAVKAKERPVVAAATAAVPPVASGDAAVSSSEPAAKPATVGIPQVEDVKRPESPRRPPSKDKARFIDWKVGGGSSRTIDESQFMAEPGRLP
ncbi:MAG: hypothetical protein NTU94_10010 [Planctomycetota bacterium]|nr:hypothetical protein [Planctomycetota bacterium]